MRVIGSGLLSLSCLDEVWFCGARKGVGFSNGHFGRLNDPGFPDGCRAVGLRVHGVVSCWGWDFQTAILAV